MLNYLISILLFVSVIGCTEKITDVAEPLKKEVPKFTNWIYPQLIEKLDFKSVCFPLWFNKIWLEEHQVERIVLTKFLASALQTQPKLKQVFTFKNNALNSYTLDEFYDDRVVGQHQFKYPKPCDSNGFNAPIYKFNPSQGKNYKADHNSANSNSNGFSMLTKENYSQEILSYSMPENKTEGLHFYLLDSSDWNYYKIDKTFKPLARDRFIYGSPKFPLLAFSLNNLIKQPETIKYIYQENKVILSRIKKNRLTKEKRSFHYNDDGLFLGFTDSLFSNSSFITASIFEISYDSLQNPYQIIESKLLEESSKEKKNIWVFDEY
ncbi:MAG: hypothetical protein ACPGU5_03870 [Lishizhenia sp.]